MQKLKERIRKEILHKLNKQTRKEALKKSNVIKNKLFSLPEFKNANCVMFYASKNDEVNTDIMIDEALKMGKRVALPLCTSLETIVPKEIKNRQADVTKGIYGICEPLKNTKDIDPEEIDLAIVPGVAFDKKNRRLGRGKGYYDKFLDRHSGNKIKIGLAFDFQLLDSLPEDSHDIPVSKVITN